MDYTVSGPGPGKGKKKQMKAANAQSSQRAKENEKNRNALRKKLDSDPRIKKQVNETILRNNNVPLAVKKGLGTLNEAGQYKGTQKGALTTKEKIKVVKFKKQTLNPKFRSESTN